MKIYTRKGDEGETGLAGGFRIGKDSARIAAIGEVDSLNAVIGLGRCEASGDLALELGLVQKWLFDLGAELALAQADRHEQVAPSHIEHLEMWIDRMEAELEPLREFILPGGCRLASTLHVARASCRAAERAVLLLHRSEPVRSDVRIFLNRLSDCLFVAARTANRLEGVQDTKWRE